MPDNVEDNPVEKREALLADRLRLHKGYRQRFVKGRNRHGRIHAFHQSLLVSVTPKPCAFILRSKSEKSVQPSLAFWAAFRMFWV